MVYKTFPRSIDVTLTGVKYQLSAEGAKAGTEPATVVIQGKLYTSLKGEHTFKGVVSIVGEQIPVPLDQRKLEIHFASEGWGVMAYPYIHYNQRGAVEGVDIYNSHILFANKHFSQVTLLLSTPQKVWNSDNGYMISAPASTREEALTMSNNLMRKFLALYGMSLQ